MRVLVLPPGTREGRKVRRERARGRPEPIAKVPERREEAYGAGAGHREEHCGTWGVARLRWGGRRYAQEDEWGERGDEVRAIREIRRDGHVGQGVDPDTRNLYRRTLRSIDRVTFCGRGTEER